MHVYLLHTCFASAHLILHKKLMKYDWNSDLPYYALWYSHFCYLPSLLFTFSRVRNHVKLGVSPRVLYCVADTGYGLGRSLGDCKPALPKGQKYQMVKTQTESHVRRPIVWTNQSYCNHIVIKWKPWTFLIDKCIFSTEGVKKKTNTVLVFCWPLQ